MAIDPLSTLNATFSSRGGVDMDETNLQLVTATFGERNKVENGRIDAGRYIGF